MQYNTINKFIKYKERVEFIVFNDAKDWPDITNFNDPTTTIKTQIEQTCVSLEIQCINIPNQHHKREFNA